MFLATIALVAATAAPDQAPEESRAMIIQGTDVLEKSVDRATAYLNGGIVQQPQAPRTGLVVFSPPDPGTDGLHALWVMAVYTDGPADRAGVAAGDRILAIGKRRIEHETTDVAELLLDFKPGPVMLTLSRGGTEMTAVVNREPLGCLAAVPDVVGLDTWRVRFDNLRALNGMLRDRVRNGPLTLEELVAAKRELDDLFGKFQALMSSLEFSIEASTRTACKTRTDP